MKELVNSRPQITYKDVAKEIVGRQKIELENENMDEF